MLKIPSHKQLMQTNRSHQQCPKGLSQKLFRYRRKEVFISTVKLFEVSTQTTSGGMSKFGFRSLKEKT